jgi:hypothetical protein
MSSSTVRKLDPRGFIGNFVGFDEAHYPGYIMLMQGVPITFKICRNVKFDHVHSDLAREKAAQHHGNFGDSTLDLDNFDGI